MRGAGTTSIDLRGASESLFDDLKRIASLRRYFLRIAPAAAMLLLLTSIQVFLAAGGISLLQLVINGITAKVSRGVSFDKLGFVLHEDLRRLVSARPGADFSARLIVKGDLLEVLLLSVLLMAAATSMRLVRDYIRSRAGRTIRRQLREDVLAGFVCEPIRSRSGRPEGTTSEIFRSDVDSTAQLMLFGVMNSLESLYMVVFLSLKVTPSAGWAVLTIYFVLMLLSQGGLALLMRPWERRAMEGSYRAQRNAAGASNRFFKVLSELLARGGERGEGHKVTEALDDAGWQNARFGFLAGSRGAASEVLQQFVLPLVVVAIVLKKGWLTRLGDIVGVPQLLGQITPPLVSLIAVPSMLLQYRPGLRQVTELLRYSQNPAVPVELAALKDRPAPAEIELRDVAVRFATSDEPILKSVCLRVPAGARVGLIGKSGSGKTTLGRLLAGEEVPSGGRILLDGIDITDWPFLCRRELVGIMYAEPGFLLDTLRANVLFGRAVTQEHLDNAVSVSGAQGVAASQPQGWATVVTPDVQLSSGEKRKIALARFLAWSSPYRVFVLDEPFANLDAAGVRDLAERVAHATKGKTSVIITHDPDLIVTDFNVFLEDGRISAIGTHSDLMRSNPAYADLVRRGVSTNFANA